MKLFRIRVEIGLEEVKKRYEEDFYFRGMLRVLRKEFWLVEAVKTSKSLLQKPIKVMD